MAKDIYHDIVKRALQKDGWTITHDPYKIPLANRTLKADLGAEKIIAAEFTDPDVIFLCKMDKIKLIVFNPLNEEIVEWKEQWKKLKNIKK